LARADINLSINHRVDAPRRLWFEPGGMTTQQMTTAITARRLQGTGAAKRGNRPRPRRVAVIILVSFAVVVATLLASAFVFETVAATRDQHDFPAPGALVDVGGHQLHILCTGQGSPTVILETGLGASSTAWTLVQPALASSTRTCAYDRAGLGWSQPGPEPRDARQISTELHSLLHTAEIAGPYVLVGHSNGGLYSRMYASMYPTDVGGIVLVEATPTDLLTRLPATRADLAGLPQQASTAEWMARFGLARLFLAPKARAELDAFPTADRDAVVANQATSAYWRALGAEARAMEMSMNEVHQAGNLGAWPLMVLSTPEGSPSPDAAEIKQQLEDEMATLSTNSQQQVVQGASHMGFATRPEHAGITTLAIRRVVDAVRSGQPIATLARP
jgi:pimeloyl-ACP methyl ester carboxylesterase